MRHALRRTPLLPALAAGLLAIGLLAAGGLAAFGPPPPPHIQPLGQHALQLPAGIRHLRRDLEEGGPRQRGHRRVPDQRAGAALPALAPGERRGAAAAILPLHQLLRAAPPVPPSRAGALAAAA